MKIGFDAKRAFYNRRGLGNYARNLIEGLNVYYPHNEYVLYTPVVQRERVEDWYGKYPKIMVREPKGILTRNFGSLWRSYFLADCLKCGGLDIYHGLSHELPFGIEKIAVKKIVTIHDLIFMRYPHLFSIVDRAVYNQKYRYAINKADIIIATSWQTKEDIVKYFHVSEDKIKIVYQSCHPRFYSHCSQSKIDAIKKKYLLPDEYALYVGAIEENKNIFSLVCALADIKDSTLQLVLVGQGKSYKNKIVRKIRELKLENRVWFVDKALDEDLPALYQGSRFFVYPSFFEGFGIPILEALFSGKAVVTSRSSSMPEAAGPGALYIDPNSIRELREAMDKLASDSAMRDSLAHEGRHHVEKFHLHESAKSMMNIYRSVVKRRS